MQYSHGFEAARPEGVLSSVSALVGHLGRTLPIGGERKTISLDRGLMQGTAYSADVFSRVMDFFLGPLHDHFDNVCDGWNQLPLGLPHFIMYADDIILFADSPASLQMKLQAIVDSLSTLGLEVNPDKSRVMANSNGTIPGLWLRGRAEPLLSEESLVFLGVPLAHTHTPHKILTHLLRKTITMRTMALSA